MALALHTQKILESLSRAVEANPGADHRTIRVRARVSRTVGDPGLARLHAEGYIARERRDSEWTYRSIRPYRARVEAAHAARGR
jgi:hypothetical protein